MKKLIMVMGVILLLCVAANAQQSGVGVTGKGVKLGFDIGNINTDYDELDEIVDSRVGFSGGAFLTYNFTPQFAIQPEILYVTKGAEKGVFIFSAEWSMHYLEIPVLLKLNIVPEGKLRPNLFVGPALSLLLSSDFRVIGESYDVSDGMKSMDMGLVFGGGVDYKRITFDVRYTLGLSTVVDVDKINGITEAEPDDFYYFEDDISVKTTNLSFMLGFRF